VIIVERFVEGRYGPSGTCEDVVQVSEFHAAVIDGASLPGPAIEGSTSGIRAAHLAADALAGLPAEASAREAVDIVSAALERDVEARRPAFGPHANRPRSVAVVYSAARREIWRVGDCHFAVDGEAHRGHNPGEEAVARFRKHYLELLLRTGQASVAGLLEHDPTVDLIAPVVANSYVLCNDPGDPFGFAALDGSVVPDHFLEICSLPPGRHEVVLTSDGYAEPYPSLEVAEREVRRLRAEDPLCIGAYPASKGIRPDRVFADDRAYLRLRTEV
jgi:hypothetical protein